jgi:transposase
MVVSLFNWYFEIGRQMVECTIEVVATLVGAKQSTPQPEAPIEKDGKIRVSRRQRRLLEAILRRTSASQRLVRRAQIVLLLAEGMSPEQVARKLSIERQTVYKWRDRWQTQRQRLTEAEAKLTKDRALNDLLEEVLLDSYRKGRPTTFSPEQVVKIIALACELPKASGRPLNHWTSKALADELVKRKIVKKISRATVSRLLREAKIKPHLSRYWLNAFPKDEAEFDAQVRTVCALYRQAAELHKQGIHLVCVDEKTGIQALEHDHPALGVKPGRVVRIEHSYSRHGTLCLIANFEVATGRIVVPTIEPTRTEVDFLTHVKQTVATDPQGCWIFVMDNLNTHQSAGLVEWVAQVCEIQDDLGIKEKCGILKSMTSRATFLADASHRIRFVYTPKHSSWLNQVEIWFSILVGRLLKRSSFKSTDELRQALLEFIDYFNKTMAKPFKWTYAGKPLVI